MLLRNCVRPEGERKPNFVFVSCLFRVGVPVYGYAEFFEIAVAVRTPKWAPRLIFAGACVGRETGANLWRHLTSFVHCSLWRCVVSLALDDEHSHFRCLQQWKKARTFYIRSSWPCLIVLKSITHRVLYLRHELCNSTTICATLSRLWIVIEWQTFRVV